MSIAAISVVTIPGLLVVLLEPVILFVGLGVLIHEGGLSHVHRLGVVEADISNCNLGAWKHLFLDGVFL